MSDPECKFDLIFNTKITSADNVCLVTVDTEKIYLVGFRSTEKGSLPYEDYVDLYSININTNTVKFIESYHYITRHETSIAGLGVHFRYGAGIQVVSPRQINVLATRRNFSISEKSYMEINIFNNIWGPSTQYDTGTSNSITMDNNGRCIEVHVYLPNCPGALFDLLNHITSSKSNITFLDFDDRGKHPERLVVGIHIEDPNMIDALLNQLKSRYRLDILEYDTTGEKLDDTVFYLRLAQKLRSFIGSAEDDFLMRFLQDINHITQELSNLQKDPIEVFENILKVGDYLNRTSGDNFYADVQRVRVKNDIELFCFQPPCGGNIYLFDTPSERVMKFFE